MEGKDTLNPQSFIEQILFSTLRVELLNDRDELQSIGTGFLVKVDFPQNQSESLVLLVSNRHVLTGSNRFNITFHRRKTNSDLPELGQTLKYFASNLMTAWLALPSFGGSLIFTTKVSPAWLTSSFFELGFTLTWIFN
ncbi:unnamed protein product [marine sediment metagenome]|uniref:Uncharacterized protein n=1 Tax=marine sediment metagenome TaxID=412755 RepID=X1CKJ3_9ZZZZ